MREALEGMATASVAHQRVEPAEKLDGKNDRLGDLTNKLNKLRSFTAQVGLELLHAACFFFTADMAGKGRGVVHVEARSGILLAGFLNLALAVTCKYQIIVREDHKNLHR